MGVTMKKITSEDVAQAKQEYEDAQEGILLDEKYKGCAGYKNPYKKFVIFSAIYYLQDKTSVEIYDSGQILVNNKYVYAPTKGKWRRNGKDKWYCSKSVQDFWENYVLKDIERGEEAPKTPKTQKDWNRIEIENILNDPKKSEEERCAKARYWIKKQELMEQAADRKAQEDADRKELVQDILLTNTAIDDKAHMTHRDIQEMYKRYFTSPTTVQGAARVLGLPVVDIQVGKKTLRSIKGVRAINSNVENI